MNKLFDSASGAVPLVIGVTGHRDLRDEEVPQLTVAVQSFIVDLRARYPDLPLTFLTGIAQGADSLVAETAAQNGCDVINVLPMPVADYRQDFEGSDAERFERLYQNNESIELRAIATDNEGALADRVMQYEQLGVFLAAHCHLLLAIWDGEESKGPGGTAQVIKFHQRDITSIAHASQMRPQLDITEDESDLVYHVSCSRIGSAGPARKATNAQWYSRDDLTPRTETVPERYDRVFQRMAEFNRDIAALSNVIEPEVLAPDSVPQRAAACCSDIQQAFGRCDALAGKYQSRTLGALRTTLGAALLAGLFFIVYADFENQRWAIFAYFAFVALAIASFQWAYNSGWQRKYVDYRVLAEALRVQYYWALAGVAMDNPSRFSHDRFFNGRDLDLGWIRNVLRFTGMRSDGQHDAEQTEVRLAVKHWVGDKQSGQLGYYEKKADQKLAEHLATNWLTNACFIAGLFAAGVLALASDRLPDAANNLLVALMGLLPLVAAARQNYAHRVAQRELVAQYAQMRSIFSFADRLIAQAQTSGEIQSILYDLGEAALNENAQWVLRQRERPLPGKDAV